jgi:hypothetical protein
MKQDAKMSDYGLGSLFSTWELKIVEGDPAKLGHYDVEFILPTSTPSFNFGKEKQVMTIDAYKPIHQVIAIVCSKCNVTMPHRFGITWNSKELDDQDTLGNQGLGTQFQTCTVNVFSKNFPVASGDKAKDEAIVQNVLQGIIDKAITVAVQHRNQQIYELCSQITLEITEEMFNRVAKVQALPYRIASLSNNSQKDIYQFLMLLEKKELTTCHVYVNK